MVWLPPLPKTKESRQWDLDRCLKSETCARKTPNSESILQRWKKFFAKIICTCCRVGVGANRRCVVDTEIDWKAKAEAMLNADYETRKRILYGDWPVKFASCQCGWKGKPEDRRTQWGRRAYCPVCGSEAPIRDFSA
jgi:hypothetical protein